MLRVSILKYILKLSICEKKTNTNTWSYSFRRWRAKRIPVPV
jgi:hypothetical protein